jgi:putative ABC transport system substrate-binding protein
LSSLTSDVTAKRLGLLKELAPGSSSVAFLGNPAGRNHRAIAEELEVAARALGLRIHMLGARSENEIDNAFETLISQQADAILISNDPFFTGKMVQIVTRALWRGLPTLFPTREYAEAGGLMSYGPDIQAQYRQVGAYTARILKGEKPSNLPVMQSTKFELVINLNTARMLKVAVPATLLALADEVIE